MPTDASKPYWIDEFDGRHEGYTYDDSRTRILKFEHEGRSLELVMPETLRTTSVKVTASVGNLLFLIGEQSDDEDEESEFEEGFGVVMVARRHQQSDNTYWLAVWHDIWPETLELLAGEGG
jgi:hypothetical protein